MKDINKQKKQTALVESLADSLVLKKVHLAEAPTGFGKTRVALRAAFAVRKRIRKGVIITTANNALAKNMVLESFQVSEDPLVDATKVALSLGRRNYIDTALAHRSIISGSLEGKLSKEEFEEFITGQIEKFPYLKRNTILISDLIECLLKKGHVVSEDEMIYEVSQASSDAIDTKDIDDIFHLLGEGMVVVTNHHYLLMLSSIGRFESFGYPIVADEVHVIGDIAESVFQSSFSFFRFNYLANNLEALAKSDSSFNQKHLKVVETISKIANTARKAISTISLDSSTADAVVAALVKDMKREIIGNIGQKKLSALFATSGHSNELRKCTAHLKMEIIELLAIADKKFNMVASPTRNYLRLSYAAARPMYDLQRRFWTKVDCGFTGISGTLRISPHKDKHENGWIFFYLGLFKTDLAKLLHSFYSNPDNAGKDAEAFSRYIENSNKRWDEAVFEVVEPLFDRNKHWYFVADKGMIPPKLNEYSAGDEANPSGMKRIARSSEAIQTDYEKWYSGITGFVHANLVSNALVLTMSNEDCVTMALLLRAEAKGRYEVLYANGNESMHSIVQQHKHNVSSGKMSVIVGNALFFTGIDLPGAELHQTFIARLPFEPKKFVNSARNKELGQYSSANDVVNKMILGFRQGFGRTIRSASDYGILYVLDGRINNNLYGRAVGFLDEVSVKHDLKYIQQNAKVFLSLEGNTGHGKDSTYGKWFAELIFGVARSSTIDKEVLCEADEIAYQLRIRGFGQKKEAIELVKSNMSSNKEADLVGALLASCFYLYYQDTSIVVASDIKADFGGMMDFYPIFLGKEKYQGENEVITDFLRSYPHS